VAKNNGLTTHQIAKEIQNYVDYIDEKEEANAETANEKTTTNGSGSLIP